MNPMHVMPSSFGWDIFVSSDEDLRDLFTTISCTFEVRKSSNHDEHIAAKKSDVG